jgi:hypothetical protein
MSRVRSLTPAQMRASTLEAMTGNRYEFRSHWSVRASPDSAYFVLAALDRYPRWWPEVREVRKVSDRADELRCRSLLPYDLAFVTHEGTRDPLNRVLEARLTGDLEGFSRWIIRPATAGTGADLLFEEEVVTNKALLRRLAPDRAGSVSGQPRADDAPRRERPTHLPGRVRARHAELAARRSHQLREPDQRDQLHCHQPAGRAGRAPVTRSSAASANTPARHSITRRTRVP